MKSTSTHEATSADLEVLRRDGERYVVEQAFAGEDPIRAQAFDAIELELGALWRG
jgi:hypothetical protein